MNYQQAKAQLKDIKKIVRINYKDDKPAQRQILNDTADSLSREFWREYEGKMLELRISQLHNFTAQLHP